MFRKTLITLLCCFIVGAAVYMGGKVASSDVGLPERITQDSACPATGCADGNCHGFDNVPEPDGIHEMVCPEAGCTSTECHAWEAMLGSYHQASDASLNLWILFPILLVTGLSFLVSRGGRP